MSDKEVNTMGAPLGYIPPPEGAFDVVVLACLPADTRDLPDIAGGYKIRQPTLTDTLSQCSNIKCGRDVWVGEKQRYLLETSPPGNAIVLCYLCAVSVSDQFHGLGPDQPAPPRLPEGGSG